MLTGIQMCVVGLLGLIKLEVVKIWQSRQYLNRGTL